MVADEPARHRDFLLAFTGAQSARDDGDGFAIDLPRGAIDVMQPAAFERRFGLPAPDTIGRRAAGGVAVHWPYVGPEKHAVLGAVLVFESAR